MNLLRTMFMAVCGAGLSLPANAQDVGFVRDVLVRVNTQRKQHGLSRLSYSNTLEKAAQAHAEWMARNNKMEHLQAPPSTVDEHRTCNHHPINRAINAGYMEWDDVFRVEKAPTGAVVHAKPDANDHVGEIIAAGWGAGHPASHTAQIVDGWMKSDGHRKEILTARYEEMGVGVACTADGKNTFWCVVFGKPMVE